ncbi:alpha-glucosidase [Paenisporosarcina sp. TG20]|uniref:glycoside hydrolase family 13 protein n=1 Tax=Paenisporosarcina sp. TG20 TaxID=1211706 RepID=UPI0002F662C4|nr:alpha-glucosidase [Paenisporosarcina sp. TG20]
MNKKWWKEAVAYQVYPRSFMDSNGDGIGDLQGLISKLDYLVYLGIDVIWICPMYKSPNDDNGYDISDYQDIMDEFGTMEDFNELLEQVHQRGMKLIIDLVINHTSDEHQWFIESKSAKSNAKRDWYIWQDGKDGKEPNNWESIFNGSAWKLDEVTNQYYLHIFSEKQPDLNWENKDVRAALYKMLNWWLDKGIDGFRVDAISHIKKDQTFSDSQAEDGQQYVQAWDKYMNVKGIQPFLKELKQETFSKYDIMTVGEANGVGIDEIDLWVGEENGKFNMIFQFEHLGLWDAENKKTIDVIGLKDVLTKWQKGLEGKGWNALFIENHDKARVVSTWGNDKEYWRESATALASMYFFMQGTPFIYQGQEIGMKNVKFASIDEYNDVALKNMYKAKRNAGVSHDELMEIIWASSRDNSRTPMQWSSAAYAGFSTELPWIGLNPNYVDINVEQQLDDEDSILHFYKNMIRLKKANDVFTYGTYDLIDREHPAVYMYTRTLKDERVLVISNLTLECVEVSCLSPISYNGLLLHNYPVSYHDTITELELNPYETRIYRLK